MAITKQKAAAIIDKSMQALDISMNMKTDPKIIKSVLEEMKLNDFKTKYKPMNQFLTEIKKNPQSLTSMFESTKQGIITKHPAIVEFAEKALAENWFSKSEHIQRAIHVAFILEALTATMVNNNRFLTEVQDHILAKRKEYGISASSSLSIFWKLRQAKSSFFETIKFISVDPTLTYYRFMRNLKGKDLTRKYVKEQYKKGNLTYIGYWGMLPSKKNKNIYNNALRINIYEAGIAEYKKGFKDNALAAHALSEEIKKNPEEDVLKKENVFPEHNSDKFYNSLINNSNFFSTINFSKEWTALYETWNLAFVLSELNNLHILLPKLLIPSVVDAKSENYFFTRMVALWLSMHTFIFKKFDNAEEVRGPENRREMAQAWGKINKKYAQTLSKKQTKVNKEELNKSFKKRFSGPLLNSIKLFFDY